MIIVLALLYALSAALPITGLAHLLREARAALVPQLSEVDEGPKIAVSGVNGATRLIRVADLTQAARDASEKPVNTWKRIRLDLALVGGGLLCGSVAGIWSLFF